MKPMRASDWVEEKLRFPVVAQPKIDGVRSCNFSGRLYARTLKQHRNKFTTTFFSRAELNGFDGEMAAQANNHPDLCRLTTSALSTIEGQPYIEWWLFDYATAETIFLPYHVRMSLLTDKLKSLNTKIEILPQLTRIHIVPSVQVSCLEELNYYEELWLQQGYEGVIVRDPLGYYKQGYSTVREGGMLRIKRFFDAEAIVEKIVEGNMNTNQAQINELGQTSRSTHQENMIPNGQVGSMICRLVKDLKSADGKILVSKETPIEVSPGKMSHEDRAYYFKNQDKIIGSIIKFQFFPKGIKDKPRFPTFQSFRSKEDL